MSGRGFGSMLRLQKRISDDLVLATAAVWKDHALLKSIFVAFCSSKANPEANSAVANKGGDQSQTMSRKDFIKICRDCAILDNKMVTAMDLVFAFAMSRPRTENQLCFVDFLVALALLAMDVAQVKNHHYRMN